MKNSKYLFFAIAAILIIAIATEEDKPETFYGNTQYYMLGHAEDAVKTLLKHPATYEQLDWSVEKTTDSTAYYVIKFTSKNSFGVPIENKAQVDIKFNTEEKWGRVTNYFVL